jgi:hypothetical protein
VNFYLISEDLTVAVENFTHLVAGVGCYTVPAFLNWNEVRKLICKLDMSMQNKSSTQSDGKQTEVDSSKAIIRFKLFDSIWWKVCHSTPSYIHLRSDSCINPLTPEFSFKF